MKSSMRSFAALLAIGAVACALAMLAGRPASADVPSVTAYLPLVLRQFPLPTPTATPTATRTPTRAATPTRTRTPTPTATTQPAGWVTILQDGFEGPFPGPWSVVDNNGPAGGDYRWGKRDCKAHEGTYSVWGGGGGAEGSSLACGANYVNNVDTWLVYGPFDLSDATAARMVYSFWITTQSEYLFGGDYLAVGASVNGQAFYSTYWSGAQATLCGGWCTRTLDLADVRQFGSMVGLPQVWVAFQFYSDSSTTNVGVFVDDVTLEKYVRAQ